MIFTSLINPKGKKKKDKYPNHGKRGYGITPLLIWAGSNLP